MEGDCEQVVTCTLRATPPSVLTVQALGDDMQGIEIDYLANRKDAIPILKSWFESEWEPYYGRNGPGNALVDLHQSCNDSSLPIAVVAYSGTILVGTAALKAQSVATHDHLSPWVAALLVNPKYRRQGIAEILIRHIEQLASKLEFRHLYIGTGKGSGTPESAIRNLGWQYLDSQQYFVSQVHVFRKSL